MMPWMREPSRKWSRAASTLWKVWITAASALAPAHGAAGQLRADCGEAGEGRERGGANEVVAAGVAVGQRVVLREDRDGRARSIGLAGLGAKGGLQPRHAAFDLDSDFSERAG